MNKRMISLLVYIAIAFLYSCEPVVEYVEVEKIVTEEVEVEVEVERVVTETVIEEKEVIEYVDNLVNTETIIYLDKEIYVVEEKEIIVEPIKEYDNYITMNNKVFGVVGDGFEEIPLITDLFKIDGVIYFKVDENLCSQENGVITILYKK